MLFAFSVLLVFQCLGEGLAYALGLPVPGPVVGMLLLFVALVASPALLARIEETAGALLSHLSLLFVPAGAGIVAASASVQGHWLGLVAAVTGGTLLTMAVTALTMKLVWREPPAGLVPERRVLAPRKAAARRVQADAERRHG